MLIIDSREPVCRAFDFQKDTKEYEEPQDDPWAGLPYTVDLETGKCKFIALPIEVLRSSRTFAKTKKNAKKPYVSLRGGTRNDGVHAKKHDVV